MTVEDYVKQQLHYCECFPDRIFTSNAYGAICWEAMRDPSQEAELKKLWAEKYSPLFKKLVYGEK